MKSFHLVRRLAALGFLGLALVVTVSVVLFRMQVVDRNASGRAGNTDTVVYSYPVKAARGEILDRYGRPLVTNREAFVVRFNKVLWDKNRQNDVILALIELMDGEGVAYMDSLPISDPPFVYTLDATSTETARKNFDKFLEGKKWAAGSADSMMRKLFEAYGLNDVKKGYTELQKRQIAGVRYEMETREFSSLVPFTFAQNVGIDVVTKIKENKLLYAGVEVDTEPVRQYDTTYAAHILGRVGKIYKDEYDELKEKGYRMDAVVGKDGAESAFEEYLRGIDGVKTQEIDTSGRVINVFADGAPQPGSNISLTIDLKLQQVAEDALASRIAEIKKLSETDPRNYPSDVAGGAVAVMEVKTGDVLALASYPTYNLETFTKDYGKLLNDPLFPMVNRAIGSAYPPGSVFKMVTAVAGLELGKITPTENIRDLGVYMKYASSGYTPQCWIYRQHQGTHGDENVSDAIRDSCNYFFFETGDRLGIENIDKYAKLFGLGEWTGIELSGEVKGSRSNPEMKKKSDTNPWYPGDTLQTAIGQSFSQFTPLQLCAYLSAVCNGGYYYKPHILKNVRSYDYAAVTKEVAPELVRKIDMSESTWKAVMLGMLDAAENGTAAAVFKDYPMKVGGKTGSAQVSKGTSNGVFAAFAPYDDPEIAVVVIVEHGGTGGNAGTVARKIMDAYFGSDRSGGKAVGENSLIG